MFETHSFSEDNERGIATGWLPGRLSERGRSLARELGDRRRDDGIAAVFVSDLRRAVETATIAFEGTRVPVLLDWRLRECDYGELNGTDAAALIGRRTEHLDVPYPGGESWREAVQRVGRFLRDVPSRWDGSRVGVIGHVATRLTFETFLNDVPLEQLVAEEFVWREGWEYRLDVPTSAIRFARPSDVEALRDLFRRSSLTNDGDRDTLLANPDVLEFDDAPVREQRTRVAVVGERIVGFSTIRDVDDYLELDDLFVDPNWMRRGVGTELVVDLVAIARSRNIARIEVTANEHARAFYEAAKFAFDGVTETRFGPALRMHLDVTR